MPAPIRLPASRQPSTAARSFARLKRVRSVRDCGRFSMKSWRLAALPLRIRPAFILYTFLTLLLLSLLGFHPTLASHLAHPSVPFSDKILHFICFLIATVLFYHVWQVEEQVRRVWWWKWFNEIVCFGVCVLAGGILSEYLQSLLPYKTFQPGDILSNLLGSLLGIFLSHNLSTKRRREGELRRLYRTIGEMESSDEDDQEEGAGEGQEGEGLMRGLGEGRGMGEMEEGRLRAEGRFAASHNGSVHGRRKQSNPWDVGEDEIFGLGGEDDDEEGADEWGGGKGKGKARGPL